MEIWCEGFEEPHSMDLLPSLEYFARSEILVLDENTDLSSLHPCSVTSLQLTASIMDTQRLNLTVSILFSIQWQDQVTVGRGLSRARL
jgi:hypothetical protein